jgi:hypothetical protein
MAYRDPADQRAAERRWYAANEEKVLAKKDRKRRRLRAMVQEAKEHHVPTAGSATSQLVREMAKCEVVCANCHRVRTWRRQQGA